jgi:hypothetical protein
MCLTGIGITIRATYTAWNPYPVFSYRNNININLNFNNFITMLIIDEVHAQVVYNTSI